MTQDEQLESARRAVRSPKQSSVIAIDAAALQAAHNLPRVVDLSSLVGFLAGAPQQAQNSNQQFQNASNESGGYFTGAGQTSNNAYNDALNKLISSTGSGSPAAQTFANEQTAALQPQFQRQQQQLAGSNAAQGITNSGSGAYNNTQLAADQSATLAGAIAPLYSSAIGTYGDIAGRQAGAQSGIAEAGAGAQGRLVGEGAAGANQAYGQAIQDFYGAASTAATGMPNFGGATPNPYTAQTTQSNTVPGYGIGDNYATATYGAAPAGG